jgi:hypothetical protein
VVMRERGRSHGRIAAVQTTKRLRSNRQQHLRKGSHTLADTR